MPVDREARDALANAIVAYMRGETRSARLDDAVWDVVDGTEDEEARALAETVWSGFLDDYKDHPISASREGWELLRRIVAFLKTDRAMPAEDKWVALGGGGSTWDVLLLLGGVIAGSAVIVCAFVFGWWQFFAAWMAIGLLCWALGLRYAEHSQQADEAWFESAPFESAEDWRAHEHLVEPFDLPAFDPAKHSKPIRSPLMNRFMWLPGTLLLWPAIVLPLLIRACVLATCSSGDRSTEQATEDN